MNVSNFSQEIEFQWNNDNQEWLIFGNKGAQIEKGISILPWPLRPYQRAYIEANKPLSFLNWAAQSGKDTICLARGIYTALTTPNSQGAYVFPNSTHARSIIFNASTSDGSRKVLDYFPKGTIKKIDNAQMFIELHNGSSMHFFGSDQDQGKKLYGKTWTWVVVSEAAYISYFTELNAKLANRVKLWVTFNTTSHPEKGACYEFYQSMIGNPKYYTSVVTIDMFKSKEEIEDIITNSNMSQEAARTELYCEWGVAPKEAIYRRELLAISEDQWIKPLMNRNYQIYAAWDLGYLDYTCVWLFQVPPNKDQVIIVDFYKGNKVMLNDTIALLRAKHGRFISYLPHDATSQNEYGVGACTNFTSLGMPYVSIPKCSSVVAEIGSVRRFLRETNLFFFDTPEVRDGFETLGLYRTREGTGEIFKDKLGANDTADAFRYLTVAVEKHLNPEYNAQQRMNRRRENSIYARTLF